VEVRRCEVVGGSYGCRTSHLREVGMKFRFLPGHFFVPTHICNFSKPTWQDDYNDESEIPDVC
jgi:hypothetical protein